MKPAKGLGYFAQKKVAELRKEAQEDINPTEDQMDIGEVYNPSNELEDDYLHPDGEDLYDWCRNDGDIYDRQYIPVVKNLLKKMKKGTYDPQLAVQGWMYVVESGAKNYYNEMPQAFQENSWHKAFPVAVRQEAARMLEEFERSNMEQGEYDHLLEKRANEEAKTAQGYEDVYPEEEDISSDPYAELAQMTEDNDHGGALLKAAELLGFDDLAKKFALINDLHDLEGGLPSDLGNYRYSLYKILMKRAEDALGPEEFEKFYNAF